MMKPLLRLTVYGLLLTSLTGCPNGKNGKPAASTQPAAPRAAQPASTTATPSTHPALQEVAARSGIYLMRFERTITISRTGLLHSVKTENKSYDPHDIPKSREQVEVREGQLTPAQIDDLAPMFVGWDQWSEYYPGVPDGLEVMVRYGNKTVSGGNVPAQVYTAYKKIEALADSMPRVNAPSTAP